MGEFFHGWRRKAGCVALVMAFGLALDMCGSYNRKHRRVFVGYVRESTWLETNGGMVELWRFHHEPKEANGFVNTLVGAIPYWWLILPLTLLSACLILRKPRKRPQSATEIQPPQE